MMNSLLEKLPKETASLLRLVGAYADQQGVACYLVGGVVRDLLLGKPTLDFDIVVEADAIEFTKALSQKYQTSTTIYPRFRTATLVWPSSISVDFASARKESYPAPGALPVVNLGSIQDDLARRDFTINAMAICLNQKTYGTLVDTCEGARDLETRKIRIFHQQSFRDDPTRILRAIRFEQRYHFTFEEETQKCLEEAILHRFDRQVSPGRYFEEFRKILKEDRPQRYLKRLDELKALDFLGDQFKFTREKQRQVSDLEGVLAWLKAFCPEAQGYAKWLIYFMILLGDYSMDDMKDVLIRFSFSRHDCNKMISSRLEYEVVKRLDIQMLKPSQIYKVLKSVSLEELVFFLIKTQGAPPEECIKQFLTDYRHLRLFVKGGDLMKRGITDGKKMGVILEWLLEKKIDAKAMTKEKELQLLDQIDLD